MALQLIFIFLVIFRFNLDNTSIGKLEALWPSKDVRDEGLITDQRELKDYQKADRLKAQASTINIMPTAEPIPLAFKHEQSRLTFRLAGQNANGLVIKDLILELTYNSDKLSFWAYCKADGTAELILPENVQIGSALADGGSMMVGRLLWRVQRLIAPIVELFTYLIVLIYKQLPVRII